MQIDRIDLKSLRCFAVVAEELHFARAALRLDMSQPPLTRRIQDLERDLGVRLFERSTRQVRLTAAGSALYAEARRLFEQIQSIGGVVQAAERGEAGTLRVGFISAAFIGAIRPVLADITARLGQVEYVWTELTSTQQIEGLRRNELDLGFVHTPIDHRGLESMLLVRERCMVAVAEEHPLARRAALRLADLRDEPFVLFSRAAGAGYYDRIIDACRQSGFEPNARHRVRHFLTMLFLPASGCGISIVPASARHLTIPGLKLLPIRDTDLRAELTVLWHPDKVAPMLRRLLGLLKPRLVD